MSWDNLVEVVTPVTSCDRDNPRDLDGIFQKLAPPFLAFLLTLPWYAKSWKISWKNRSSVSKRKLWRTAYSTPSTPIDPLLLLVSSRLADSR